MQRITLPLGFGIAGFCVGTSLCGYTFYLASHHQSANDLMFLILCPPSIAAMALDQSGFVGGILGWLIISFVNAGLYAVIGTGVRAIRRGFDN